MKAKIIKILYKGFNIYNDISYHECWEVQIAE
jgi:hypothetical protein